MTSAKPVLHFISCIGIPDLNCCKGESIVPVCAKAILLKTSVAANATASKDKALRCPNPVLFLQASLLTILSNYTPN